MVGGSWQLPSIESLQAASAVGRRYIRWSRIPFGVWLRRSVGPRHQVRKGRNASLVFEQHLCHRHRYPAAGRVDVPQFLGIVLNIENPGVVDLLTKSGDNTLSRLPDGAFGWLAYFEMCFEVAPFDRE